MGGTWRVDGSSVALAFKNPVESGKTSCTLKDTEAFQFQDSVQRLPNSTYLDLVDQLGPGAEEFESPLTAFRENVDR